MPKNFTLTGQSFWCKLLGEPQPGFDPEKNFWTIDVSLDQKGLDLINRVGLGKKIRNKDDDRGDFFTFRRPEYNRDNERNNPIPVVDNEGNPWPEDKEIGNGSKVRVKFGIFEAPARGKFPALIKAVPYEVKVVEWKEFVRQEKKDRPKKAGARPDANRGDEWKGDKA